MSTDTIERLKAANLVPHDDGPPPFMDTERRIAQLVPSAPRRLWRAAPARRLALPLAVAAGVALAVVVVPNIASPNVVAEARAAVAPGRDIVHVVTQLQIRAADREPGGWDGRQERWSSTDPYRSRTISAAKTPDGLAGSVQTVFDGATASVRRSWDDQDIVDRLSAEQQREDAATRRRSEAHPYLQSVGLAGDPVQDLRTLLADGSLRPVGRASVDGRDVQRLVAHVPRRVTETDRGDVVEPAVVFDYFVDAETFDPVRITATTTLEDGTADATTTDFLVYERLPATPENAALLTLPPR